MTLTTLLSGIFGRNSQAPCLPNSQPQGLYKSSDLAPDVRRLIRQRQYCKILSSNSELPFDPLSLRAAWETLQQEMSIVPPGKVLLAGLNANTAAQSVEVASCYVDRFCVTNSDFVQFVESGGYDDTRLWPETILTDLLRFTDSTGAPGPRYWSHGKPAKDSLDHPVVGVCWFEANAYAQWAGKRLPSPAQWQRAATWGKSTGGSESRYPWGNSFIQGYANTWSSRVGTTVPVHRMSEGATPSGIHQLVGNTWEWMNGHFNMSCIRPEVSLPGQILAELRGGAFDTYFASQATCQFRTGQPLLDRASNIGFRCCIESDLIISDPNATNHEGGK